MREGYKKTDVGEIPESWEVVRLGDITEKITKGSTPTTLGHQYTESGINFVKVESISANGCFLKNLFAFIDEECHSAMLRSQLKEDDLLFSIAGALGRVAVVDSSVLPANTNQALAIIRLISIDFKPYIFHYLRGNFVSEYINKINVKTAQANLSLGDIQQFSIPFPPLPEQQKIAEILSTVDEKIEVIGEQISQTQQLKRGLMQRLLTKGIGHTQYKDSLLGKIPEGWDLVELGQVFQKIVVGYVGSISDSYCDKKEGVQLIRTLNVRDGYFDPTGLQYVINEFHQKNKKSWVENGDILIARVGANMGMTCKVSGLLKEANAANVIIIKQGKVANAAFYAYFLSSELGQKQMNSRGVGGAQAVLNTRIAQKLIIPLPPLHEQQKIADILSTVDDKLEVLKDKKQQYQELKRGLMQKLLTGKVRVTNLLTKAVPA